MHDHRTRRITPDEVIAAYEKYDIIPRARVSYDPTTHTGCGMGVVAYSEDALDWYPWHTLTPFVDKIGREYAWAFARAFNHAFDGDPGHPAPNNINFSSKRYRDGKADGKACGKAARAYKEARDAAKDLPTPEDFTREESGYALPTTTPVS